MGAGKIGSINGTCDGCDAGILDSVGFLIDAGETEREVDGFSDASGGGGVTRVQTQGMAACCTCGHSDSLMKPDAAYNCHLMHVFVGWPGTSMT